MGRKPKRGADDVALDFYDRGRIASWGRDHVGLVVWTRNKICRSIPGWRPYGAWAYAPDGIGEYLLDDTHRIRTDTGTCENVFQPLEGIQRTPLDSRQSLMSGCIRGRSLDSEKGLRIA